MSRILEANNEQKVIVKQNEKEKNISKEKAYEFSRRKIHKFIRIR